MRTLITGGTGSLGRALLRSAPPDTTCVVYSRSESRQAECAATLPPEAAVRWVLGDVRDRERLEQAMGGCQAVIHAAALKRVDSMAYNPGELRKTNIEGSAHVIAAAVATGVERVLLVSSDKAAAPINAYGISNAAMEQEAIASNSHAVPRGTRIACTRYGNVLGSTGSVLPVWRAAMAAGRPLPLTDPAMTRFGLTLAQAAAFVWAALAALRGGELLVPVLPAMRLGDLAEAVAPGWPVQITGPRPGGEKWHETLLTPEEGTRTVAVAEAGLEAWAVNPALHSWCAEPPWTGEPWPAGAEYRSDRVARLSVAEMRAWLAESEQLQAGGNSGQAPIGFQQTPGGLWRAPSNPAET